MRISALPAAARPNRTDRSRGRPGISFVAAPAHRVGRRPRRLRHHRDTPQPGLSRLEPRAATAAETPTEVRWPHAAYPHPLPIRPIHPSRDRRARTTENGVISSRVLIPPVARDIRMGEGQMSRLLAPRRWPEN